jgi:hypothetical protein
MIAEVVHKDKSIDLIPQVMGYVKAHGALIDLQYLLSSEAVHYRKGIGAADGISLDLQYQITEAYFIMTKAIQKITGTTHDVEDGIDFVLLPESI